jgi:hypothetical protein
LCGHSDAVPLPETQQSVCESTATPFLYRRDAAVSLYQHSDAVSLPKRRNSQFVSAQRRRSSTKETQQSVCVSTATPFLYQRNAAVSLCQHSDAVPLPKRRGSQFSGSQKMRAFMTDSFSGHGLMDDTRFRNEFVLKGYRRTSVLLPSHSNVLHEISTSYMMKVTSGTNLTSEL